ncbi:MAG: glycosyltransferase family 2 protein [Anaerolineae bacterium]|nr:glycosyltransferase family 2 protein [Anaerolineae bacterium]MDH7473034.1 glycosyltransferase family 2 protein [Anaerolineae bacterium]
MKTKVSNDQPLLSIVVPAYNEERRLPGTLETIIAYLRAQDYRAELIVVDDGSSDGTVRVVERYMDSYPGLRLIRNDHRGKAYTVRTGVLAAEGQYVIFTDADLAVPIEETGKALAALMDQHDVVIGSREALGARRYNEPFYRHLMGRVFNFIVRLLALPDLQDTQCGFKGLRHDVAQDLFQRLRLYGADAGTIKGGAVTGFDVELLFLARKRGYSIKEVPVQWYYGSHAKVNPLRDSWRNFKDVLRVRLNDWRGKYDE